jgi:hypothetical protein
MSNQKNTFYDVVTDKRTVPYNSTKTGTITTLAKDVVGVGTLFTTELKAGDWIYVAAQNELRQITGVFDDTSLEITHGFTVELAAAPIIVTPKSDLVEISAVIPTGSAPGEIDGKVLYAGLGMSWGKASRERSHAPTDFVDPIIINGTGTTIVLLTLK